MAVEKRTSSVGPWAFVFASCAVLSMTLVSFARAVDTHSIAWTARNFSCDTNEGSSELVISFRLSEPMTQFAAIDLTVYIGAGRTMSLPDWWQVVTPGSCRAGALSLAYDLPDSNGAYQSPWGGSVISASDFRVFNGGDPHSGFHDLAGLKVIAGTYDRLDLQPGVDYQAVRILIDHSKTVGTDACGGCCTEVAFYVAELRIYDATGERITSYADPLFAYWPSSVSTCQVTPVVASTWGKIKALYR